MFLMVMEEVRVAMEKDVRIRDEGSFAYTRLLAREWVLVGGGSLGSFT